MGSVRVTEAEARRVELGLGPDDPLPNRIEVESYAPVGRLLARAIHGPPDWIVSHFPARARRAFGFWVLVGAAVGAIFFGGSVLYVTILSVVALVPNFTTETPVEAENDEGPP